MPPISLHVGDLPEDLALSGSLAVDTETMGLNPTRDRLCLVQIADETGACHLVKIDAHPQEKPAPRLAAVLADHNRLKIMHFARFDLASLYAGLGVMAQPVFCTRTASRLCRTYTERHGLKELVRELLGKEISKSAQSSDWGAAQLSAQQLEYAANDVIHLHALKTVLRAMLVRERRDDLAAQCFAFLPVRARLDLEGWHDQDIFSHTV